MKFQRTARIASLIVLVVAFSASVRAAEVMSIAVYPNDITLQTKADFQGFVVVATRDDGVTLDVTDQVTKKLASAEFARLDGSKVFPVRDGETKLELEYLGHKTQASVNVKDAVAARDISFHLDIMPVLMRSGCNTGSCHGAKSGKDGFRLSLFGFDPKFDYHNMTREIGVRRINLAVPEESLVFTKSIGAVPHTGGKRFEKDSEYGKTMLQWLSAGAPIDAGTPPNVTQLDIFPPKAVIEGENTTQQFIARAHYSNGTTRDVTNLVVFLTNNDNSAPMSDDGLVTAKARGEAFVMARFETKTVGSQILVLPKDMKYKAPTVTGNYVDQLVGDKLNKIRVLPSGLCSDEEFLRRATVDIAGMLPTEEEYRTFVSDKGSDKRAKKIDELLGRKEFSEIWTMKWAELLMIKSSNQVSTKSAFLYNSWLTDQIANEVPLDEMVRNLLGATGGTFTSPATNYYQLERDTLKTAENVAQVFMGIRTQCAQCHNHPFDRWTMDDYYSFAAFFAQVGRKTGEDYREQIVYNRAGGDVRHPVGNLVMAPKFLGGVNPETKGKDRRAVVAEWLTAPDNPYFSKNVANRVWAHFFGIGIVEPIDDIRVSNPASNPELLAELGRKLVEYKYDFKQLVRDICNSQAYQRTTVRNDSNATDDRNFAHANVRRIPAETLLDCLSQITNTKDKFRGLPLGARATQIADGRTSTYFLDAFGRAERETVCACESTTDPSLSQALHMLNGSTTNSKITQGKVVTELVAAGKKPEDVIDSLYMRALCRQPTADEKNRLMALAKESKNPTQGLEDVFWAVLNGNSCSTIRVN